jgi:hypothetical protein
MYQVLELLPESSISSAQSQQHQQWWTRIWRRFYSTQSRIPIIWKTTDRQQNAQWNVFDPVTGRTMLSMSDKAFQSWFEDRYFRF